MTTMYESLDTPRPVVYDSIQQKHGSDYENPVETSSPVSTTYESIDTSKPRDVVYDSIQKTDHGYEITMWIYSNSTHGNYGDL